MATFKIRAPRLTAAPMREIKSQPMSWAERMAKVKQAEVLLREVEFSFKLGDSTRQEIHRVVSSTFGLNGYMNGIKHMLEREMFFSDSTLRLVKQCKGAK